MYVHVIDVSQKLFNHLLVMYICMFMLNIVEIFIFMTVIYVFVKLVICNSFFNMTTAI